ncbi:Histone H1B [Eumeta japonica]|uniref:Histone H1B n=1 Tax=Eumeta variegata TaxID=151549 RepID=A0A4C2A736_EUMVA|nr:Histone H1B [Eumeta japonica]
MTGRGKEARDSERWSEASGKCSAITSRASQAGYPSSRSQGRRETYIRSDLRRDARSAESVPRERDRDAVTYTEHAKRRPHRYGRRLRAETSGAPSTGSAVKRPGPRRIYESTVYDSEAPASQRRQPDFRAFDTVYSGVPRPIYRNATIERLKPNRNFYFGPRHRSRIRFESLKSREGQVKSCNNVDEKRSVGREALITVYPTVREVVDSGASRFAYLAFVRICIRRVPRIRSTGADDSRRRGETEGYRGRWRRRCRQEAEGETDASEDFEMVNNAIRELKERSGSSLQAIKKYIAAQYKVDAEKHAPFIRKYLKSAVESGTLIQTKGGRVRFVQARV